MSAVSFRTKGGKSVSFKAGKKRKGKRKLSPYNKHVAKAIRSRPKGQSAQAAMRAAAKSWKG